MNMNMMKSEDCISSCSSNGVKLPIGYRFCPTDEELLLHYLTNKAFSLPLPASVIPDFDVFHTLPWNLPGVVGVGGSREKGYFFCNRKNLNLNVKIGGGRGYYWKQTGKDRQIVASSGTNHVVGTRKTLVFCQPKRRRSPSSSSSDTKHKTRWVMHELRLLGVSATPNSFSLFQMGWADWGVYRVFQRKTKLKRKGSVVVEESKPSFIDFSNEASSPPPCSPCFSEASDDVVFPIYNY